MNDLENRLKSISNQIRETGDLIAELSKKQDAINEEIESLGIQAIMLLKAEGSISLVDANVKKANILNRYDELQTDSLIHILKSEKAKRILEKAMENLREISKELEALDNE